MIWLATPDCIHESIGWLVSMIPTATSRSTLRLDVMPWAHEGHMVGHVDVLDWRPAELAQPPYLRFRIHAKFMHEINASMAVTHFKIFKFLNFYFSSFAVTPKIFRIFREVRFLFLLWNENVVVTTTGFAVVAWTFRIFCPPILYPEPSPPPEPPPFLHLLDFKFLSFLGPRRDCHHAVTQAEWRRGSVLAFPSFVSHRSALTTKILHEPNLTLNLHVSIVST